VSDELRGEKIDVIRYAPDLQAFISNALAPAKVLAVELFEDDGIALVTVPDHQLSLAIGREGQNVRLAARLTGWRLDITSDSEAAEARARYLAEREAVPVEEGYTEEPLAEEAAAETEEGETVLTIDDELLRRLEEFKREQFGSE
jgi:N utilization substance protein A